MIAQVIVNHNSRETDKPFDYLIPEELEGQIGVGNRVIVPFGRGNKQKEAYIIKINQTSKAQKLKSIISVAEGGKVFDEKMLKLVFWMRERYLCKFIDVIHSIVPAGISAEPEEWLTLKCNAIDIRSEQQKKIVSILKDNEGSMEINYFLQFFENNIHQTLSKLISSGVIEKEYKDPQNVKDKKLRVAELAIEEDDAYEVIEDLFKRRAHSQAKMLEILLSNEFVSVSDLVRFSQGSYNAVSALVKKGYINLKNIVILREPVSTLESVSKSEFEYTDEQKKVINRIDEHIENEKYAPLLLWGVTGSGKTEVYMNAIEKVLKKGKKAIVLVPEISLTPQLVNRFRNRFSNRIALFHSGLSLGEKYDQWKKMRDGKADIVIGARSAVFAPFDNIGIIIMDEEHETTYKSEMPPRYSTKEVARFRAMTDNAILLLASATPDIKSFYQANNGELELLTMKKRTNEKKLPEVMVVDMREELEDGNKSIFSRLLAGEINKNLENKEQTILFLNRRGFSTFVSCRSCGYVAKCPSCNISLTYHKYDDSLRCHYCGYTHKNYSVCPECGSKYIRYFGGGTQKVEEEIKKLFPEASTIRMDVDTTGRKFAHEKILNEFEKKKIDILIGTQMVAKGLDFENVTLVGVVSADVTLNIDDYSSSERSFSLLEQVSGRAGRGEKSGRAIIQTYAPEHLAIQCVKKHNYEEFYNSEILMRKAMWYPPFCDIILVGFSSVSETLVQQSAKFFKKQLEGIKKLSQKVQILGPVPSGISKIKNKYRWQLVIKCENQEELNVILEDAKNSCLDNKLYNKVIITIDKNPNMII